MAAITTPKGKCPFILEGKDDDSILAWIKNIRTLERGVYYYGVSAIQYWVRDFYDCNTSDWAYVTNRINHLINTKKRS